MRIELLGRFRVVVGGHEIPPAAWPGRRPAELVQLLALADDRRLPRDEVIEALWPRLDAEAGAANLRKAAHFARQTLGDPEAVVLRGGVVALFPSMKAVVDAAGFEAGATAALAGDSPAAEVAAAYAGDLLPDSPYEDWTQAPRERLRSLYLDLLRSDGEWERIVELDPTDEPAYRELMRRERDAGSRAAAIRWYGRLRTAMRRELGLAPSAETEALYDACVAHAGLDETVFVGRQIELAAAAALLRPDDAAGSSTLVLRGPAGIGKSALCRRVDELADAAGRLAVTVVATEAASPYAPIASAAEQLLAGDAALLEAAGDRARSVLAEITPLATAPVPARLGRPLTRHEVIGAFGRLLAAAATNGPVVLILDDAHLADEATIDLLLHLASSGPAPIAFVLAYRSESAPAVLVDGVARLLRTGAATAIDIGPLDREEGTALIEAGTPVPRSSEAVARILDLSEGNPFLALELARSPVAGVPSLTATTRDAILSRLVDLDRHERMALARLALAGDALDPAGAVVLAGATEEEAFALLDRALAAGVLIVAGARYRFRHELVRHALAEQMPPHDRSAAHREIAAQLAAAGAAPAVVARQWLAGERPGEAEEWLLQAAGQAMDLGAFGDALTHLAPVLEHRPDHPDALLVRAEALDALGDGRAPAAYAAAADVAGDPAADELRARQALAQIKLGDPTGGLAVLKGIRPRTVEGRLAEALAHCGAAALGFGNPEVGARKAAEARRLAIQSQDTDSLVIASWAHAAAAHARGDLRNSVKADLEETQALPKLAVSVFDGQLCITQRLLYGARPYPDVIDFATSLADEADRLEAARGRAFAVTIRGEAKLLSGRLEEADEDLARGVELHRELAAATGEAFALQRRAEVALRRGDRAEAVALLDQALAVARESDVGFHLLDRIYGARIEVAPDPASALAAVEEAEAAVRGPVETCPGCRITLAVPAAIAAARGGDSERAERWESESEYLANVVMRLPAWYAALEEIKGHRAGAARDPDAARRHFRAAAEGFAESGQALDEARCAALAAAV